MLFSEDDSPTGGGGGVVQVGGVVEVGCLVQVTRVHTAALDLKNHRVGGLVQVGALEYRSGHPSAFTGKPYEDQRK